MRRTALLVVCAVLGACQRPISTEELASKYTANPTAYAMLREMIREDTGDRDCFTVGLDNIDRYWLRRSGQWSHTHDYQAELPLSRVLQAVGLGDARYEEYKRLFAVTGSERVRFCRAGKYAPEEHVMVLVYRTGLAVSGCSGTINWRKSPPAASGKRGEGDFNEVTLLDAEWYLEYGCT